MQNPRKEVNAVLKKEAAYFGDIVILPFMDRYELVVLKTIAICDYGVSLFSPCTLVLWKKIIYFRIFSIDSSVKQCVLLYIPLKRNVPYAGSKCDSCSYNEMRRRHIC